MTLLMTRGVVMWQPRGEGDSSRHARDGSQRIGLTGYDHPDALSHQTLHQPLTRTLGYQNLRVREEKRMILAMVGVHGHLSGQVQPSHFHRQVLAVGLEDEKPSGLSGVIGNGLKILTGDGDTHGLP